MKAGSGFPTCYKPDLAFPEIKLAVEVDGASHSRLDRQSQDVKKTNFLTGLGWTVLRFSNKRALEDTQNVKEELRSIILRLKGIQATP
jgi:very-short-patch-repair endonuclease